jgi:hypothetical protein
MITVTTCQDKERQKKAVAKYIFYNSPLQTVYVIVFVEEHFQLPS